MPEDDLKMWFGIIVLIVVEVALITPPVGLLILFPTLILWLPQLLK